VLKETFYRGKQDIDIEEEIFFENKFGTKTIIPFNSKWKRIVLQASGGLDSSLLLFLTAKAFKEKGAAVEIFPLSLEIPTKAKNLESARRIIATVKKLTGYEHLKDGIEVVMPLEEAMPPKKNEFFNNTIIELFREYKFNMEFNGNTRNPPEEDRVFFPNDNFRELHRDDRTTIYNSDLSVSPHSYVSKKGIVSQYIKYNLLEDLAVHTVSCDMNLEDLERRGLGFPCMQCWWCYERKWGFDSNNIKDPAT
jgi:hypothetical protein